MTIKQDQYFQTELCWSFTSARLCPVYRIPPGLHAHGTLATISAPIRSGPSFPHYMCQWARRLSGVKLAVICGAWSALGWWSRSNCERHCEHIHCVCKCNRQSDIQVHGKTTFTFRCFWLDETAERDVSDQRRQTKTEELQTSAVKRDETWREGAKLSKLAIGVAVTSGSETETGKED